MGSRLTRTSGALAAVLLALTPVLVACGGNGEPEAEPSPTEETTSASPTSSPSPTKTGQPLSEFEDRAPVKAARKWAALLGRGVNKGDDSMRTVAPWATPSGVDVSARFPAEDLENGNRWPGPQPFTPVRVSSKSGKARVVTCLQTKGWSVDPKTDEKVRARKIEPAVIELVRAGKRWKVAALYSGSADCQGVKVRGVKW
jgi:hypothetical protein